MDTFLKALPYIVDVVVSILLIFVTYKVNATLKGADAKKKQDEEREQALADGVQALLRESIVNTYNKYKDKNYCPIYAREAVQRSYEAYEKLGGNDVAHDLYNKILDMPTEKKKEEEA